MINHQKLNCGVCVARVLSHSLVMLLAVCFAFGPASSLYAESCGELSCADVLSTLAEDGMLSADPHGAKDADLADGRWLTLVEDDVYLTSDELMAIGGAQMSDAQKAVNNIFDGALKWMRDVIMKLSEISMKFMNEATTFLRFPAERLASAVINSLRDIFSDYQNALSRSVRNLMITLYSPVLPKSNDTMIANAGLSKSLKSALEVFITTVLGIGVLFATARALYGLTRNASLALEQALYDIMRIVVIALIAFNGQNLADGAASLVNSFTSSACGGDCTLGGVVSSLVLPAAEGGENAGADVTPLINLMLSPIIVPLTLIIGLLFSLAKFILSSYVLFLGPFFIAFLAIPYGEGVFAAWIDAGKRLLWLVLAVVVGGLLGDSILRVTGVATLQTGPIQSVAAIGSGFILAVLASAIATSALLDIGGTVITTGGLILHSVQQSLTSSASYVSAAFGQRGAEQSGRVASQPATGPSSPSASAAGNPTPSRPAISAPPSQTATMPAPASSGAIRTAVGAASLLNAGGGQHAGVGRSAPQPAVSAQQSAASKLNGTTARPSGAPASAPAAANMSGPASAPASNKPTDGAANRSSAPSQAAKGRDKQASAAGENGRNG